ncbi:beta-1,3-galactosyltransferase 1-like isoform X2 [Photinus pyralis]|uniref:beta-1,3-galactosyltransferase 1-like isoform X2 n=1 Tax=Photinus pyralis TaxID=7054 RepID=UPI0012671ED9|nr:beta-1,3-galactosyltransferase 1-like isoform X2 [Photinus pyralis]
MCDLGSIHFAKFITYSIREKENAKSNAPTTLGMGNISQIFGVPLRYVWRVLDAIGMGLVNLMEQVITLIQGMHRHRARRWLFITFLVCGFLLLVLYIYEERMGMLQELEAPPREKVKPTTIEGWTKTTSRDASHYVNPAYSTLLMKPRHLCPSQTYLMIIVCSSPPNFDQRIAVRETWGLLKNTSETKMYFLLGKTHNTTIQEFINIESDLYQDIVVDNFVDTYNNLTIKSLMLLKLVKLECKDRVKFVMKVDDDTFVNMNNLIQALKNVRRKSTMFGKLICRSRPIRDYYEKWFMPKDMYSKAIYPNYLSGTAYVMTTDIAVKLFETALTIPLVYLEDVYVTVFRHFQNYNTHILKITYTFSKFPTPI